MYQKKYIYICKFYKGREYNLAFKDLDKLRQYLVYGWDLTFDENKITDTGKDREFIYEQDNITIEKVALVE